MQEYEFIDCTYAIGAGIPIYKILSVVESYFGVNYWQDHEKWDFEQCPFLILSGATTPSITGVAGVVSDNYQRVNWFNIKQNPIMGDEFREYLEFDFNLL